MKIEEIYKRIMVCEKKERDFLEVGNTRTANRYHNEIQKWEKLLNQLNPKMEKELNEYRRGYYKQKEVINKAIEKINDYKIYCEENKGFTEYTDIEIEAIEPVISKLEDILKDGKK